MVSELEAYKPLILFISQFLGADAEIVLYDVTKEEAIFVQNSFHHETVIGSPIRSIEQRFIKEETYKKKDSVVNYRAFSADRKKLRSASHFIKNHDDELIGILTINYVVEDLIELRNILNHLISGSEPIDTTAERYYESFNLSFEDLMNSTIQEALTKFNVPPDRLSHNEKMELIRTLEEKGTFLIKGSITELARILNTTETSIYRYINKL